MRGACVGTDCVLITVSQQLLIFLAKYNFSSCIITEAVRCLYDIISVYIRNVNLFSLNITVTFKLYLCCLHGFLCGLQVTTKDGCEVYI